MKQGKKKRRLVLIAVIGVVLSLATALVLYGLNDQIALFKTPTNIAEEGLTPGQRLRIGGLVKKGSWVKDGTHHRFVVTDQANDIAVTYEGILPDLFREGQGVVLEGAGGPSHVFVADTVLAKHDENYIPKEVADALKEQGVWQEGDKLPVTN